MSERSNEFIDGDTNVRKIGRIKQFQHRRQKKREAGKAETFMTHLKELRRTLIGCIIAVVIGAIVCYQFFRELRLNKGPCKW